MPNVQRSTDAPLRPSGDRVLGRMTLHVELIPIRETTSAREVAWEVSDLLRQLTNVERIERGHVSDHRWHCLDPEAAHDVTRYQCSPLVTTDEAAAMLGVTSATVRRMVKRGDLDDRGEDRRLEITLASVRAFAAKGGA